MAKWCWNFETGDYELIERDGLSLTTGNYSFNWDDSEYVREEEEECRREEERFFEEEHELDSCCCLEDEEDCCNDDEW